MRNFPYLIILKIAKNYYQMVRSMVYPYQTCNGITAMLIFADDAEITPHLEDSTRKIYSKIKELNVPA